MDLQTRPVGRASRGAWIGLVLLIAGCQATQPAPRFSRVSDAGGDALKLRTYESEHYRLHTSVPDEARVGPMIARLESTCRRIEAETGIRPQRGPMEVYVFRSRDAWQAFTSQRTGASAPIYLQLERGGYTYERFSCLRDQGEHDTLDVLGHEAFHLYVATQFEARPPPFIEEGLAVQCETPAVQNAARSTRLALMREAGTPWMPLRKALSLHAGNVVGLSPGEVDGFYAQAWAFTRFLSDPATAPSLREGFQRLLNDAASGALSGADMSQNPVLVERYLGDRLESIQPAYFAYLDRLAARAGER